MFAFVRHPEFKVVAVVVGSLLLGELAMRGAGDRLSQDVAHLQSFPESAQALDAAAMDADVRVLFLGNSLTRYGVEIDTFDAAAEQVCRQRVAAIKVTPDNTAVADWFYAYQNFFAETGRVPDVLVIGFEHGHLRDAPSIHPQRLARFYCDAGDWEQLCERDLHGFEDRASFLLASQSALLSDRDRIERRALDLIIPGYQDGIQELNSRLKAARRRVESAPTYDRLAELIDIARRDSVQVVLVAMPVPTPYELDADLVATAERTGAVLLDCREISELTREMFPDGLHMNAAAAEIFSRRLALEFPWPKEQAESLAQTEGHGLVAERAVSSR
jgi:hypothetical protein